MSTTEETTTLDGRQHPHTIQVIVSYLPAAAPFRKPYVSETIVETVRTEAMGFFGVRDRQERDTYRYFLELGGSRITDLSQTLGNLVTHRPDRRDLHFNLVEEITPGSK